ncbi:ribosomal L14 [Olea europaea subsp. europaea]|uniref:Ribosomal L14 (Chloroplast) n=1 Tax=Olea europaea subsp. europaea TaxID=158383 RepID=A0A8S0V629_OLEEU|nr:ribosomal L14 [Olea europaea subsp. europaea]
MVFKKELERSLEIGARELMCIRIIGASNRRYAHIGDVIVAVITSIIEGRGSLQTDGRDGPDRPRLTVRTVIKSGVPASDRCRPELWL